MKIENDDHRLRPVDFVALFASGVLMSVLFGATTNAVNGRVSAEYYMWVMRWDDADNVAHLAIGQGIFEGALYGFILSLVFTSVVGVISRIRCPFVLGFRHQLGVFLVAFGGWLLGGLLGMLIALLRDDENRSLFYGGTDFVENALRFMWVSGSIWGAILGGGAGVVLMWIVFRENWSQYKIT
jgi:hypothetical protein